MSPTNDRLGGICVNDVPVFSLNLQERLLELIRALLLVVHQQSWFTQAKMCVCVGLVYKHLDSLGFMSRQRRSSLIRGRDRRIEGGHYPCTVEWAFRSSAFSQPNTRVSFLTLRASPPHVRTYLRWISKWFEQIMRIQPPVATPDN